MNISIVIPNYNGLEIMKKNLPVVMSSVRSYRGNIDLVIIDDASKDESATFLKQFAAMDNGNITVTILVNEKNRGFSPTVNRAVKHTKGDIIILLNTDVAPEKDFYRPLLPYFTDDTVFAVGCMDKSIEDGKTVLRGRGVGEWKRGFLVHKLGALEKETTLWVNGGSGAFRKNIWDRLGGFNELFAPFYWEDIDLSYRALKSGYKLFFEPKSIVVHEHDKGAIKKTYKPLRIRTIAYRNQFIFVWENATDFAIITAHIIWLPYHIVKAILRKDRALLTGFFRALLFLPKVLSSRFHYKSMFRKRDQEVISEVGVV